MTIENLARSILFLIPVIFFSLIGPDSRALSQVGGITLGSTEDSDQYHSFINLLQNGDFEIDDDVDTFPDGWLPWQWVVEDQLDLRKAILAYLGTSPDAIVKPRLTTRFPFFGKRSLALVSADGKTGPGIFLTREFSPGVYTLSLYAKNPGEGKRRLGAFLAAGGRLFEVGQRWRNIVLSQRLSYYVRGGEISLRDWTFLPGELLVDRVVLWKLPFDLRYTDRIDLSGEEDHFVVEFSEIDEIQIPVGINLEIESPTGEMVRKNIEGALEPPMDEVVFELKPQAFGIYRLKLEIYDLRTADIIFSDQGITALYEPPDSVGVVREDRDPGAELQFFPVGIRARGHELSSLLNKDFNSVLITEPSVGAIDLYRSHLSRSGLKLFFEVTREMMSKGCDEEFHRLIDLSRTIEGFSGWFVDYSGWGNNTFSDREVELWQCLNQKVPDLPVVVKNYLPRGSVSRETIEFEYIAVDPNPISEPSRPLFTMGMWADQISGGNRRTPTIGMPQVFGGWPIAHRVPTYDEVRGLTYLAVIHGAKGIIYRDFSSLRPFFDQSDALWDIRKIPELWSDIPVLNRELRALAPYFLGYRVERTGISLEQDDFIDYGSWREDESVLLVAVNVYEGDIDAVFSLERGSYGDEIEVLFEERTIEKEETGFTDHFGPFETHVYRLSRVGD